MKPVEIPAIKDEEEKDDCKNGQEPVRKNRRLMKLDDKEKAKTLESKNGLSGLENGP